MGNLRGGWRERRRKLREFGESVEEVWKVVSRAKGRSAGEEVWKVVSRAKGRSAGEVVGRWF